MKNYRIKKVTENGETRYYIQQKFLWWWRGVNLRGFDYFDYFYDLDNAKMAIRNTVVEYIYDFE